MSVERLKKAIDVAFSDARLERTLREAALGIKNWRFNLPSLNLVPPAGPFASGGRTSDLGFQGSFDELSEAEKRDVESYYDRKVSEIDQQWHGRFPMAFGKPKQL